MRQEKDLYHPDLDKQAHEIDYRHVHWFGRKSGSSRTIWRCNLCKAEIDRESSKYPMTKHTYEAIKQHMAVHLK